MRIRTPLGQLPASVVVAGNVAFWPAWTFVVGWIAQRTPDAQYLRENVVTRPHSIERDGDWYRVTWQIHRWKDRLPEAGALYGGFTKRTVSAGDVATMEQFVIETRRAELAHWGMAAGVLVTTLWNPWWAAGINAGVAASSNIPCIAVQRYNRLRLGRAVDAARRRATSSR